MRQRLVRKGNQQPVAAVTESTEQSGLSWCEAQDGALTNLDLAQSIQVYEIDSKFSVIASYNDGSEVVLVTFDKEDDAWAELDAIKKILIGNWRGKR